MFLDAKDARWQRDKQTVDFATIGIELKVDGPALVAQLLEHRAESGRAGVVGAKPDPSFSVKHDNGIALPRPAVEVDPGGEHSVRFPHCTSPSVKTPST